MSAPKLFEGFLSLPNFHFISRRWRSKDGNSSLTVTKNFDRPSVQSMTMTSKHLLKRPSWNWFSSRPAPNKLYYDWKRRFVLIAVQLLGSHIRDTRMHCYGLASHSLGRITLTTIARDWALTGKYSMISAYYAPHQLILLNFHSELPFRRWAILEQNRKL